MEAVSCYQGILAVLVTEEEQKHVLRLYTVEVNFSTAPFIHTLQAHVKFISDKLKVDIAYIQDD